MASTIIQPITDALVTILRDLTLTEALTVPDSGWGRDHLAKLPAAEIDLPDIGRTDIDEPESQINSEDWDLRFPVTIYYDLREPTVSQERLIEAAEKFIAAIDDDPTLSSLVQEAKVTSASPVFQLEKARTLVAYVLTVDVLQLVAQ